MFRSPTVGRQSANSRPTVDGKISRKAQITVGQLLVFCQATVFWGSCFSTLASAVKRMHVLVVMNSLYMYFFTGIHFQFDYK